MLKESKTKTFVLRIDATTMAAVERWAGDEFRSVNGQILFILNEALRRHGRLPKKKEPKPPKAEKPMATKPPPSQH
ncbi:MAG: Arc family DNA-binding protein [Tannerella sp.]|jgi:hypothetical protein|nr:Arc family DNA-binding protein [Tannerella sp.]